MQSIEEEVMTDVITQSRDGGVGEKKVKKSRKHNAPRWKDDTCIYPDQKTNQQ